MLASWSKQTIFAAPSQIRSSATPCSPERGAQQFKRRQFDAFFLTRETGGTSLRCPASPLGSRQFDGTGGRKIESYEARALAPPIPPLAAPHWISALPARRAN
jgi:hypothetical protein